MTRILRDLILPVAVVVFLLGALSCPANASLIGDSVTCAENLGSLICSPSSATVTDPGSEFILAFFDVEPLEPVITVDLAASSITLAITLLGSAITFPPGVQTLTFADLDSSAGDIVGVSLATSGIVNNLTVSDISFTAHSVTLDLVGASFANEGGVAGTAVITLLFGHTTAVPAPAALVVLVAGVVGVGAVRVWRRR